MGMKNYLKNKEILRVKLSNFEVVNLGSNLKRKLT
jgi:hypothetical protein